MFKNQATPRIINRPAPTRSQPGAIYTQRSVEFARIMGGAR
jgi:hypothetical protein